MPSLSTLPKPQPKTLAGKLRLLANRADRGELLCLVLGYLEVEMDEDEGPLPDTIIEGHPAYVPGVKWVVDTAIKDYMDGGDET